MLKELFLENFVIAKSLKIPFEKGFNVITGETGAGKTLLLQALGLISGNRSDFKLIRSGFEKACLQATFDISSSSDIFEILKQNGCEISSEEFLMIRRELFSGGKTRVFINNQECSLLLLKKISPYLFESVSQNMQIELKDPKFQEKIIDSQIDIQTALKTFQKSYKERSEALKQLESLTSKQDQKSILLESLSKDFEEISSIDFSDDSENALFEKYKTITTAQETYNCLSKIFQELSANDVFLTKLYEYEKLIAKLETSDHDIDNIQKGFSTLSSNLKEILSELDGYLYKLNFSETEFLKLEEDLSKIKSIKRRFGPSPESVEKHFEKVCKEKYILENIDEIIEEKEKEFLSLDAAATKLAKKLSALRQERGNTLSSFVTEYLHKLDMEKCEFKALFEECKCTENGIDRVTFSLKSSKRQDFTPIAKRASGGELSRILLSLKIALKSESLNLPLIFDEIDANIGGETATKIGEQLKVLAKDSQIISITHFPQVARSAIHHLKLSKTTRSNEIFTQVEILSRDQKHQELLRMLGGKKTLMTMNIEHPN